MSSQPIEENVLYRDRAILYDLIYHWKDYTKEARRVRDLLHAEDIRDGSRVLEAACGTGTYMQHLGEWFDVAGFDLYDEMLTIAREKLPAGTTLFQADMTDFAVERSFDALLCLFSSIVYVDE
jgi:ubiquinone/menaquinone biosynthesis C-methylase UbiE